ncbi:MAG: TRAP transporter small permease [Deltaproteobacteria bacterium]|nr:TRAP transporter small permease [Deltaproteobacteria bacterium]
MIFKRMAEAIGRLVEPASRWINYAGGLFLFAMMLLVVVHVAGRYFLDLPVPGAVELIEFLMTFVVFFGFGFGAVQRANVCVDLFVQQLPKRVQAGIDAATCLLSIGIVGLITWQGVMQARSLWESGHVSGVLHIPHYPFLIVLVIGCLAFGLVLVQHLFEYLQGAFKK